MICWGWANREPKSFQLNHLASLTVPLPRYINHSCAPNCVAEVVTFDKEDKIIIISSRRIPKGEEVRGSTLTEGHSSSLLCRSPEPSSKALPSDQIFSALPTASGVLALILPSSLNS